MKMVLHLYSDPKNAVAQQQERVVIFPKYNPVPHRSGYYVGGSQPPLVDMPAITKRASK